MKSQSQLKQETKFLNTIYAALEEVIVNAVYHRNYEESEPITIRIEKSRIMFYNCGGPDRSIKLKDLQDGTAVSGRYRNRRLGDFLKEMDLTEGRSTGLSLIHRELSKNGFPTPLVETDDERTFFRIIIPIHPAFEGNNDEEPIAVSDSTPLVKRLKAVLYPDDQASDQVDLIDLGKMVKILQVLLTAALKKDALSQLIALSVHAKNVQRYIDPLEKAGLIEKTIPEKPTSPKQQYRLTMKGKALQKNWRVGNECKWNLL